MAALRPVLVGVALVGRVLRYCAFVHMVAVDAVNVAVVHVIGVPVVRDRDVTAALAVGVLVTGVRRVLSGIWHGGNPLCSHAHRLYEH
jgi:hypothetical protein